MAVTSFRPVHISIELGLPSSSCSKKSAGLHRFEISTWSQKPSRFHYSFDHQMDETFKRYKLFIVLGNAIIIISGKIHLLTKFSKVLYRPDYID